MSDAANPYAPPRSAAPPAAAVPRWRWALGAAAMLALVVLWWIDLPRAQVARWISALLQATHPSRLATWTLLFCDRLAIELAICLPAAALLAFALRARAVRGAVFLALEQWVRCTTELQLAPNNKHFVYLLMTLAMHSALLVAGTAWAARRRRRPAG